MVIKKTLLAEHADLDRLVLPSFISVKGDGVRGVIRDFAAVSRSFEAIPNNFIRTWMAENLPEGIDGEIMLRDPFAGFNAVQSAVMSADGEPDFVFRAFDYVPSDEHLKLAYGSRLDMLERVAKMSGLIDNDRFAIFEQHVVETREQVVAFYDKALAEGWEGAIVRTMDGVYKEGRSTVTQGTLLKLKPKARETATVIEIIEQMKNTNPATKSKTGKTKRSTAKAGMVGKGVMGALRCKFDDGAVFKVASGFDDADRKVVWDTKDTDATVIGGLLEVEFMPDPGGRKPKQAPRHPVAIGFRSPQDLG